jgi:hypothetical protein
LGSSQPLLAWLCSSLPGEDGVRFLAKEHNDLSLRLALGFMGAFIAYLLGYFLSGVPSQRPSL